MRRLNYTTRMFILLNGFIWIGAGAFYVIFGFNDVNDYIIDDFMLVVTCIGIVLSVLSVYVSRRLGRNIDRLRVFVAKIERGETVDLDKYGFASDELGEISTHIVSLYNKERDAIAERDRYYRSMIEEEKEKTRVKHRLTNNINHEIKTPVHAVQGCLETIVMNADVMTKEQIVGFVEKSRTQMQRLCSLLNDVSTITRIADGAEHFKREDVDLADVVTQACDEVEMLPAETRLTVSLDIPASMPMIGNRGLLDSIFHNLISNAVAYSGGATILVRLLADDGERYRMSFADDGNGIDEAHLDHIFERFYRVDEGRSRKIGGTGLGLSIVKNAVMFHGGDITVGNRDGGGLEFIFSLCKDSRTNATSSRL
ncbi:MAG: ATP-binding protein [Pseudoflavonifractor sp.]|nr:ATP-binding protein [Pseudoflavonifractor sp.]